MAPRKVDFAIAARAAITAFAEAVERIGEVDSIFKASGYNSSGSNPIMDDDLSGHDITAANLGAVSIFAENVVLFLNNGSPMRFDYASAIDKFRNM